MQNIIIIILAVFLIIVAKPDIIETFKANNKQPLAAALPSNLEGRITELEKNYSAFNEKLSFFTINNGTVKLNGNFQINGKLFFNDAQKCWIQDGNGTDNNNMIPGYSMLWVTQNPRVNNEQRNIRFHSDGAICGQPSGRGDKCAF